MYAIHGDRHIGKMQCGCSELAAAGNFKDHAGEYGGNYSTLQTDDQGCPLSPCRLNTLQAGADQSIHCTPSYSYSSLFARMQGGKKAEVQGQGSGMTGAKGKGGSCNICLEKDKTAINIETTKARNKAK